MIKRFTLTINTTHSVPKILYELELLANELVERDEDVIEIKYEKRKEKEAKHSKSTKKDRQVAHILDMREKQKVFTMSKYLSSRSSPLS